MSWRRAPSNASLLKISAFTGLATIAGISYIQWSLQSRLRESPYCKLAITTLREHRGAIKLLGEDISSIGYDLADSENNYCNGSEATYQVKVKGSKDQGKMFLWAKRRQEDEEDWLLDRLELEIKSQPNRRYIIKRTARQPQEEEEVRSA